MNSDCSNLLDLRNLQKQVKRAFCYQKLFWSFTVRINCSSDLKTFENSRPSASNFKSFSRSLEQFFLTVGQNNFGNKIPFLTSCMFLNFVNSQPSALNFKSFSRSLEQLFLTVGQNNFGNRITFTIMLLKNSFWYLL